MALASGTRLGPYEILGALGAGGMGEVYKARDTRLDRTVALKVIQPAASASPEMRERFEREARAISALDHPHICILYDVCRESPNGAGPDDATSFLVMQYLEGETLADRLARAGKPLSNPSRPSSAPGEDTTLATISRGPMAFDATLKCAVEIALALDAAHRRGIVHRDLKPGNVMLTKTGTKLLDFGLAKLAAGDNGTGVGFGDQTRTSPLTSQGAILGTLHYMSPEQLEGREVDSRSDIHAFGAVLFEMLSGRRAFDGQSQAGTIAAILNSEPPALTLADTRISLPPSARRALDRLLAKCLAKDPEERWQSAADLAAELKWIGQERLRPESDTSAAGPPEAMVRPIATGHDRVWKAIAAVAVLALAGLAYLWYPRPAPSPAPVSFTIAAPDGQSLSTGPGLFAISPDGRKLAFTTGNGATTQLWVRDLGSLTATRIERATAAWHPAWSPDSRSIVYTEGGGPTGALKRVDLAGGAPKTLAPMASGRPAWGRGGIILFKQDNKLYKVAETGGTATVVMEPDEARTENNIDWPLFLPDGRRYLFAARAADPSKAGVFIASLDSPQRTFLLNVMSSVEYAPGYLFYQRDGTLMAHPFDADAGRLTGEAFPLVEGVRYNAAQGRTAASVAESGTLVYLSGAATAVPEDRRIILYDGAGKVVREFSERGSFQAATLSPNGPHALVSKETGSPPIRSQWLLDLERGVLSRFTVGGEDERNAVWSPDGAHIVFASQRGATWGIYRRSSGGGATSEELLFSANEALSPSGFSSDGQRLLFTRGSQNTQRIWLLPMGDKKPIEVFPGGTQALAHAVFSPDDRWIAYTGHSNPADADVFIQPYPADGRREQISNGGGRHPRWTGDGRRIVYRSRDSALMAVDITSAAGTWRPGTAKRLFEARPSGFGNWFYSMNSRADRFLLVQPPEQEAEVEASVITVIVNFVQSLAKK